MLHLAKELNAFAIEGVRGRIVFLLHGEAAQIGERSRDAPTIFEFVKHGECPFIERTRSSGVALISGDVALIVQSPSDTLAIADGTERFEALGVECSRLFILAFEFGDAGEIA